MSNLTIVVGLGSNGSRVGSTSTGRSKSSTSTLKVEATTTSTIGGKKVATPKIVYIDYSVVKDINKARENILSLRILNLVLNKS